MMGNSIPIPTPSTPQAIVNGPSPNLPKNKEDMAWLLEVAEIALSKPGLDVNEMVDGTTALELALDYDQDQMVKKLVEVKADYGSHFIHKMFEIYVKEDTSDERKRFLTDTVIAAVREADTKKLTDIITSKLNSGKGVLELAMETQSFEFVQLMVENGAELNPGVFTTGQKPVDKAVQQMVEAKTVLQKDYAEQTLELFAQNKQGVIRALVDGCLDEHVATKFLSKLVQAGGSQMYGGVNMAAEDGSTALHKVVADGKPTLALTYHIPPPRW